MISRVSKLLNHWVWMLPIFWIVAGLAVRQVDRFPISVDELLSMNNAGYINGDTSPASVLGNLQAYSAQHVPAYFVILGAVSNLLDWSPPVLRMLGVWSGLLALAGIYRLGREHISPIAGLYAVLFVAGLSLYSFYYAHIRMYTMLVMATAWLLWAYLRVIRAQRPIHTLEWLALSASTLLFLSTHIFSITLMATLGLYHLLIVPKNRRWLQVSGAIIIGGLPLVPWLPVLLSGFRHTSTFSIVTNYALTPPEIAFDMMHVYSNGIIPLLLGWLAVAVYLAWRRQPTLRFWLGFVAVTVAVILILGGLTPIIPPDRLRYTFVLIVPLALVFGGMLSTLRYHVLIALVILGGWFASDLWMLRQGNLPRYLGGRMNIYDMPRVDDYAQQIASVTNADTLILNFSNHHDLNLVVRHGNTIQDFYFNTHNRQQFSLFIPQAQLLSDDDLQTTIADAITGWSRVAWVDLQDHYPPKRIHRIVEAQLADYQACDPITITAQLTVTPYVKNGETC